MKRPFTFPIKTRYPLSAGCFSILRKPGRYRRRKRTKPGEMPNPE
jgi:hypothetical protein